MAEQLHDGKLEVVRGREDIGYGALRLELRSGRTSAPVGLTEDDEAGVDPISRGLSQEIFQPLPAFL
jgi:hypothetical protein